MKEKIINKLCGFSNQSIEDAKLRSEELKTKWMAVITEYVETDEYPYKSGTCSWKYVYICNLKQFKNN